MKKSRIYRGMLIQYLICTVLIFATIALLALMSDRKKETDMTPPAIAFPSNNVEYTLGSDKSILLDGVTAKDEIDGDVTSSVRIRSISVSEDSTIAVVSYVARDSANNIALEKRIVDVKVPESENTEPESNDETEEKS